MQMPYRARKQLPGPISCQVRMRARVCPAPSSLAGWLSCHSQFSLSESAHSRFRARPQLYCRTSSFTSHYYVAYNYSYRSFRETTDTETTHFFCMPERLLSHMIISMFTSILRPKRYQNSPLDAVQSARFRLPAVDVAEPKPRDGPRPVFARLEKAR